MAGGELSYRRIDCLYHLSCNSTNCTWSYRGDYRILADDADDSMRAAMQADSPLIPPDEIET